MKNKILIGIMSVFLMSVLFYSVDGAMETPVCYAATTFSLGGVNWINFTIEGYYNVTNCEVYMQSASTANNSWVKIGDTSTDTLNGSLTENGSIMITSSNTPEDAPDYQIRGRCQNLTNSTEYTPYCTVLTGRTVDFSKPKTPILTYDDTSAGTTGSSFVSKDTLLGLDDVVYGAVEDFTNITANGCSLYFNNDIYTMTEGTTSASYTLLRGTPSDRFYDYFYVVCTDGTNSSKSTTYNDIEVDSIKEGAGISGGYAVDIAEMAASRKLATPVVIILAVVAFWFVFIRKKN